jgi:hypothetical protein
MQVIIRLMQQLLQGFSQMPFKSQSQRKWMYANDPKMAEKWEEHTPKGKKLPKKVKKKSVKNKG